DYKVTGVQTCALPILLPAARVLRMMTQACASLAEAHRAGILHRDIKPENLFLSTAEGQPDFIKVVDFGIAKVANSGQLTGAGMEIGRASCRERVESWE